MKYLILVISIIGFIGICIGGGVVSYQYSRDFRTNWNLADKASTIKQKSEYIDKFIGKLESSGLNGTNAGMFFTTDNTSFNENIKAIKSLQTRLHDIQTMDENSFAYQTAIQQITEQEQGQADDMLSVFRSCWMKVHHYFYWNEWFILLSVCATLSGIVFSSKAIADRDY